MELAHFYGWSIPEIRQLKVRELDAARKYMIEYNKNQGGGQQKNGS